MAVVKGISSSDELFVETLLGDAAFVSADEEDRLAVRIERKEGAVNGYPSGGSEFLHMREP